MTLKMSDIEFKAELPTLPRSLPVFALTAPPLEERRASLARLGERLRLGELRPVELDHGTVLASPQGDITYFHASGGVWARDAMATRDAKNEFRQWDGLVKPTARNPQATLAKEAARKLIGQARELLQPLGLLGKEVASEAVQLEQVAQLDEKGREIASGAGQATVKFQYAVANLPVRGAGAKTLAFVEPEAGQPRFAGVFHAWRSVGQNTAVKLPSLEESLGIGLLADPELTRYRTAGHSIRVTRLEFVYLALPAFMRQSHLFPAFQIEGTVSAGTLGIAFDFGRFHHAAPPRAYAAAGVYGPYLSINPDGISPADPRKTVR